MGNAAHSNIGAYIACKVGLEPLDNAAGTRNGSSIDRLGYGSCTLFGFVGAASGSPTAQTADYKLQDSADGSTGWADISGASITQLTADDAEGEKDVNLETAKRYIRVVETIGFTGGTSPKIEGAAVVVLGGKDTLPA